MINRFAIAMTMAIIFLAMSPEGVADEHEMLGIEDLLALRSVSDPQVSPDGRWVAYAVERNDLEADESSTQLFMVTIEGDATVQLTADDYSASSPRWSPDGRYLAFLAAKGGDEAKTQVWTLDRRGGEAQVYTAVDQGVRGFAWSPDGKRMLLEIKDKTAAELAEEAAEEAGEDARPVPYVIDRLQFKRDGQPYLDRSRTHLYILDERVGEARQVTFGDYDDAEPAWSPDGKYIAFVSNRTEEPDRNQDTNIWLVAADEGNGELVQLTENPGSDYAPAWSRDGRHIAYVTVTEPDLIWYATNHLAVVDVGGREERVLTRTLDRNVISPRFGDRNEIYFILENSAAQDLWQYDLDEGQASALVRGDHSIREFDLVPGGGFVSRMHTAHGPGDLYRHASNDTRQLTSINAGVLANKRLAAVRNVEFPSADGTTIEGFIFTPPDYTPGRRYPTILRIHGGPVAQYDFSFNSEAQLLAAHGYVVVTSNPRGSSGYGQAFSAELFANWGVRDFEDVMAAVDHAIAEGYADPDRLGVGGWSYGGILTNYVITKSDRFEGAISGASEVNYIANYGHDHYQYWWEAELGLPWENREAWERISPWNDVDKVVTPTLVIGGKEDWNVPIQNSEQLYQALKRRGIKTELVVYPDEAHGISRPSFVKDRYLRYLDWYDNTVRGM